MCIQVSYMTCIPVSSIILRNVVPKPAGNMESPTTFKVAREAGKQLRILAAEQERLVQDLATEAVEIYLSIPAGKFAAVEDFIRQLSLPEDLSTKFQTPQRREKKRA